MEESTLNVALSALESVEMRSLAWGFVDQSLGETEAESAIAEALQLNELTDAPEDVLDVLRDMALVRVLRDGDERRYRTRMAELVRLLVRLRQWFDAQSWRVAPTLVSDFRFMIQNRSYPRRSITPDSALRTIDPERAMSKLQIALWNAMTGGGSPLVLADFQVEAAKRLLSADRGTGTVVASGTGSGKTLAFYLPALVGIAHEIRRNEWWTKVVCLYPRQELLKDQLSEAYALALRTADTLIAEGRRPLVLGSLFGPTPFAADQESLSRAGWTKRPDGYVCPFLRCPVCSSDMQWSNSDVAAKKERLICENSACGTSTNETLLRLTRKITDKPPDLLFTTTEMMNQRLSDLRFRRVFGVGQDSSRQPLFTLLDEVHTYAGVPGAQTALLLRRWTVLLGKGMRWTGLSATLPHAAKFFADLTGLRADKVVCIEPAVGDMVSEGAEYQIILRSDASSQTATLSTSIQAIMLLSRMLDGRDRSQSRGRFGSKMFVFTDDLDVTHRLFDDLRDAEAYTAWGREDPSRLPLAALRGSVQPEALEREYEGQRWQMAEDLRGNLTRRLRIGRTTSRDPGVDAQADVVVATSALEVGFNDQSVGAVIQHKAPRSFVSFLQRRGRAGRKRGMRPLILTVLSDYGRDRIAFQSYEQLFEPTAEPQQLPVLNPYVLRMQAVFATLDWFASLAPSTTRGWIWRTLACPQSGLQDDLREHVKCVLDRIVKFDAPTLEQLRGHLQRALRIDRVTLDSILWYPPRALLTQALPTLARRLFRDWQLASGAGLDLHRSSPPHPLPDFVPSNLFSDLNLPEVQVVVPGQDDPESMPIVQALRQFVPGRVRRRFADSRGDLSHWFPVDPANHDQSIALDQYASRSEYVGIFPAVVDGEIRHLQVYRPWELRVSAVPRSIADSSNSSWDWKSDFELLGHPTVVHMPVGGIEQFVDRIEFRLHRTSSAVSIRRFAHDGTASLRVNGNEHLARFRLTDNDGAAVAVGFVFEADAMVVPIRLPTAEIISTQAVAPEVDRWLRYLAVKRGLAEETLLPPTLNVFRRDWLRQVAIVTAVVFAERQHLSLSAAIDRLLTQARPEHFEPAIAALVSGLAPSWRDDSDTGFESLSNPARLHQTLLNDLRDSNTRQVLLSTIARWVSSSHSEWGRWLLQVLETTIAQAVYQACATVVPQNTGGDGLTVDEIRDEHGYRAMVAETTLGGGGTIEAIADKLSGEPRAFVRALESACSPSDQEMAAQGLRQILRLIVTDEVIADALAELRSAVDTSKRSAARQELFKRLAAKGVPVSRTLSILFATRFVRPGAGPETDRLSADLLQAWTSVEEKYRIALPARLAAAVIALSSPLREQLAAHGGDGKEIFIANLLMWPAGGELRQFALQAYNPYGTAPMVDSAIARRILFDSRISIILLETPEWRQQLTQALSVEGIARLVTSRDVGSWSSAIADVLSTPVVSGFLHFYPMVDATRVLDDGAWAIDLLLRDRV